MFLQGSRFLKKDCKKAHRNFTSKLATDMTSSNKHKQTLGQTCTKQKYKLAYNNEHNVVPGRQVR